MFELKQDLYFGKIKKVKNNDYLNHLIGFKNGISMDTYGFQSYFNGYQWIPIFCYVISMITMALSDEYY